MLTSVRLSLLSLLAATCGFAAGAKTTFTNDDLTLGSRSEILNLLGYPAEIEMIDPQESEIGASSKWTFYFESSDHKILSIGFWFFGDKQLTHEALDYFGKYKAPFRLLRSDDVKDIHRILLFKRRAVRRN